MNLLLPESGLLFWMTIIFVIVFFLLAKFGFPVITGMVEKRTKRIDDALEAARKAEDAIAHLNEEQERILTQTRAEQSKILKEASAERDRIIAQAREQAQEQAGLIVAEAKAKIAQEKENALRDARNTLAELSVAVAEKILKRELEDETAQKKYVEELMEDSL